MTGTGGEEKGKKTVRPGGGGTRVVQCHFWGNCRLLWGLGIVVDFATDLVVKKLLGSKNNREIMVCIKKVPLAQNW